jgi:hypothetical protein
VEKYKSDIAAARRQSMQFRNQMEVSILFYFIDSIIIIFYPRNHTLELYILKCCDDQ